jgi:D-alanine-D-alanine ligase
MKKKINVTVLSGGFSNERDISLLSGAEVFKALDKEKYTLKHIDISKKTLPKLADLLAGTDVCFIALHGAFGEDGHIQAILNNLGIAYTGSGLMASALCMDKYRSMSVAESVGLTLPKTVLLTQMHLDAFLETEKIIKKHFGYPVFVKPNNSGSSMGAGLAKNKVELEKRLKEAFSHDISVVVQEVISGRELTCAVVGNFGDELLPLPPVEIKIKKGFFDRAVKYDSQTVELCPAPLTKNQTEKIQELAVLAHDALGCDGVTRSDFLLKGNTFYYLETNTIPGLTENSLAPKEAKASQMTFASYLDLQISLALKKHNKSSNT